MSDQTECRMEFEKWFGSPVPLKRLGETYQLLSACSLWGAWKYAWEMCEASKAAEQLAVIKAAKDLLTHWKAYCKHAGTHEEAYYRLAKYAYPEWKKLEAALEEL